MPLIKIPSGTILNTDSIVRADYVQKFEPPSDMDLTIIMSDMEEKVIDGYDGEFRGVTSVNVKLHFTGKVAEDLIKVLRMNRVQLAVYKLTHG